LLEQDRSFGAIAGRFGLTVKQLHHGKCGSAPGASTRTLLRRASLLQVVKRSGARKNIGADIDVGKRKIAFAIKAGRGAAGACIPFLRARGRELEQG